MTWKTVAATMAKTIKKCALLHLCFTWAVLLLSEVAKCLLPRNALKCSICLHSKQKLKAHTQ